MNQKISKNLKILIAAISLILPFEIIYAANINIQQLQKSDIGKVNSKIIIAKLKFNVDKGQFRKSIGKLGYGVNYESVNIKDIVCIDTKLNGVINLNNQNQKVINNLNKIRNQLLDLDMFEYIEFDYIDDYTGAVNDSSYSDGTLWGLKNTGQDGGLLDADIDADLAWDIATGSTESIVAVMDSGCRITHNDLMDNIWKNIDEVPNNGIDDDSDGYIDNFNGIDAFDDDGFPEDLHGHGTHCSGTIAASANDGNPHVGVAYNAKILPCKLGDRGAAQSAQIKAIDFLISEKVKIANCSYGGFFPSQAVFEAMSKGGEANILFLVSAGNSSNDNDTLPAYPASYDLECIVSVAATDRNDEIATFSNFGLTSVDLGAPGVEIFSTTATNDQSYEVWAGTSMAAPHVAGVVALIRSVRNDWSVLQVREKLLDSVDIISSLDGKTVTSGRLNAAKAVQDLGVFGIPDGNMELSVNPPSGSLLMAGEKISIFLKVIDGEKVENAIATMLQEDGSTSFFSNDGIDPDLVDSDNVYTSYFKVPDEPQKLTLTLFVSAEGKNDAIRVINYNVANIPENDNFKLASKINSDDAIVESFNTFATVEPGEPRHSGLTMQYGSLWWKWTSPVNGNIFIDTAGSDIDANIAIYQGNKIDELILIGNNQNYTVENRKGHVSFKANQGKTYKFCISSPTNLDLGYIRLRVSVDGRPDINNPMLYGIKPINGFISKTNRLEISGFSHDPEPNASGIKEVLVKVNENNLFNVAVGKEEWFMPLALEEGENTIQVVSVDYSGNTSNVVKYQYDYFPPDLTNDHFVNASPLNLEILNINKGQTILELSRGVENKDKISLSLNGKKLNNNDFELGEENKSILIFKKPFENNGQIELFNPFWITETITTNKATKEFNEPNHAGNDGGKSVWFKFKAPYDGYLTIDILKSEFDTLLAMYQGNSVSALNQINSNDDAFLNDELEFDPGISQLKQALKKDMVVYIAADGYGSESGNIALRSRFDQEAIYKLRIDKNGSGEIISPFMPFNDIYGEYALFKNGDQIFIKAEPSLNNKFFGWSGDLNFTDNEFDLVISDSYSLKANFKKETGIFNFEDVALINDIRWKFGDENSWIIDGADSYDGSYSLKSGDIEDNNMSVAEFTGNFYDGVISFALNVSSERDWDKLEFYIDNKKINEWSGTIDWKIEEYPISAGIRNLKWVYSKDFANSSGGDFARIDRLVLPLGISATSKISVSNGQLYLDFKGEPNHTYEVYKSYDLNKWDLHKTVILNDLGSKSIAIKSESAKQFFKVLLK